MLTVAAECCAQLAEARPVLSGRRDSQHEETELDTICDELESAAAALHFQSLPRSRACDALIQTLLRGFRALNRDTGSRNREALAGCVVAVCLGVGDHPALCDAVAFLRDVAAQAPDIRLRSIPSLRQFFASCCRLPKIALPIGVKDETSRFVAELGTKVRQPGAPTLDGCRASDVVSFASDANVLYFLLRDGHVLKVAAQSGSSSGAGGMSASRQLDSKFLLDSDRSACQQLKLVVVGGELLLWRGGVDFVWLDNGCADKSAFGVARDVVGVEVQPEHQSVADHAGRGDAPRDAAPLPSGDANQNFSHLLNSLSNASDADCCVLDDSCIALTHRDPSDPGAATLALHLFRVDFGAKPREPVTVCLRFRGTHYFPLESGTVQQRLFASEGEWLSWLHAAPTPPRSERETAHVPRAHDEETQRPSAESSVGPEDPSAREPHKDASTQPRALKLLHACSREATLAFRADRFVAADGGACMVAIAPDGSLFYAGCSTIFAQRQQQRQNPAGFVRYNSLPAKIRIQHVALGHSDVHHALLLTVDGAVMAVGDGANGVLGTGNDRRQTSPAFVNFAGQESAQSVNDPVVSIAVSKCCSAAVTESGKLFSWGKEDGSGQTGIVLGGLGAGSSETMPRHSETSFCRRTPTRVWALRAHAVAVTLGAKHMATLCRDGSVFTNGASVEGECGLGRPGTVSNRRPTQVFIEGGGVSAQVTRLVAGSHHTLALTKTGRVFGWGSNKCGQLGHIDGAPSSGRSVATPCLLQLEPEQGRPKPDAVAFVVAGPNASVLQACDGTIWCAGRCGAHSSGSLRQVPTTPGTSAPEGRTTSRHICFATDHGFLTLSSPPVAHSAASPQPKVCVMGQVPVEGTKTSPNDFLGLLTFDTASASPTWSVAVFGSHSGKLLGRASAPCVDGLTTSPSMVMFDPIARTLWMLCQCPNSGTIQLFTQTCLKLAFMDLDCRSHEQLPQNLSSDAARCAKVMHILESHELLSPTHEGPGGSLSSGASGVPNSVAVHNVLSQILFAQFALFTMNVQCSPVLSSTTPRAVDAVFQPNKQLRTGDTTSLRLPVQHSSKAPVAKQYNFFFSVDQPVQLLGVSDCVKRKKGAAEPRGFGFGSNPASSVTVQLKLFDGDSLPEASQPFGSKSPATRYLRTAQCTVDTDNAAVSLLFRSAVKLQARKQYCLQVTQSRECDHSTCSLQSISCPNTGVVVRVASKSTGAPRALEFRAVSANTLSSIRASPLSKDQVSKVITFTDVARVCQAVDRLRGLWSDLKKPATGVEVYFVLLHTCTIVSGFASALSSWPVERWCCRFDSPGEDHVLVRLRKVVEYCMRQLAGLLSEYRERGGCVDMLKVAIAAVANTYAVGFFVWCPSLAATRLVLQQLLTSLREAQGDQLLRLPEAFLAEAVFAQAFHSTIADEVGIDDVLLDGPVNAPTTPWNRIVGTQSCRSHSLFSAADAAVLCSIRAELSPEALQRDVVSNPRQILVPLILSLTAAPSPTLAAAMQCALHTMQERLIVIAPTLKDEEVPFQPGHSNEVRMLPHPIQWKSTFDDHPGIQYLELDGVPNGIMMSKVAQSTIGVRADIPAIEAGVHMWEIVFKTNPGSPGGLGITSYNFFDSADTLKLSRYGVVFDPANAAGSQSWVLTSSNQSFANGVKSSTGFSISSGTWFCLVDLRPGVGKFVVSNTRLEWSLSFWTDMTQQAKRSKCKVFENVVGPVVPVAFSPWFGAQIGIRAYARQESVPLQLPSFSTLFALHEKWMAWICKGPNEAAAVATAAAVLPFQHIAASCDDLNVGILRQLQTFCSTTKSTAIHSPMPRAPTVVTEGMEDGCATIVPFGVARWTFPPRASRASRSDDAKDSIQLFVVRFDEADWNNGVKLHARTTIPSACPSDCVGQVEKTCNRVLAGPISFVCGHSLELECRNASTESVRCAFSVQSFPVPIADETPHDRSTAATGTALRSLAQQLTSQIDALQTLSQSQKKNAADTVAKYILRPASAQPFPSDGFLLAAPLPFLVPSQELHQTLAASADTATVVTSILSDLTTALVDAEAVENKIVLEDNAQKPQTQNTAEPAEKVDAAEERAAIIEKCKVQLEAELRQDYPSLDGLLQLVPLGACTKLRELDGNADAVANYYFEHFDAESKRISDMEEKWVREAESNRMRQQQEQSARQREETSGLRVLPFQVSVFRHVECASINEIVKISSSNTLTSFLKTDVLNDEPVQSSSPYPSFALLWRVVAFEYNGICRGDELQSLADDLAQAWQKMRCLSERQSETSDDNEATTCRILKMFRAESSETLSLFDLAHLFACVKRNDLQKLEKVLANTLGDLNDGVGENDRLLEKVAKAMQSSDSDFAKRRRFKPTLAVRHPLWQKHSSQLFNVPVRVLRTKLKVSREQKDGKGNREAVSSAPVNVSSENLAAAAKAAAAAPNSLFRFGKERAGGFKFGAPVLSPNGKALRFEKQQAAASAMPHFGKAKIPDGKLQQLQGHALKQEAAPAKAPDLLFGGPPKAREHDKPVMDKDAPGKAPAFQFAADGKIVKSADKPEPDGAGGEVNAEQAVLGGGSPPAPAVHGKPAPAVPSGFQFGKPAPAHPKQDKKPGPAAPGGFQFGKPAPAQPEKDKKPGPAAPGGFHFGKSAPAAPGGFQFGKPAPAAQGGGPFGKQDPAAPGGFQFGKPAPAAQGGFQFGKPAPAAQAGFQFGKPAPAQGGFQFGKPAPAAKGGFQFGKPAPAAQAGFQFGKPAPAQGGFQFGKPARAQGGFQFGKPAPAAQAGFQFGKPAPAAQAGFQFGKPAPAAQAGFQFGKPARAAQGGFQFGKPAPAPQGGFQFGKPGPAAQGGFVFGKPAPAAKGGFQFGKPAPAQGGFQFGKPAAQPGRAPRRSAADGAKGADSDVEISEYLSDDAAGSSAEARADGTLHPAAPVAFRDVDGAQVFVPVALVTANIGRDVNFSGCAVIVDIPARPLQCVRTAVLCLNSNAVAVIIVHQDKAFGRLNDLESFCGRVFFVSRPHMQLLLDISRFNHNLLSAFKAECDSIVAASNAIANVMLRSFVNRQVQSREREHQAMKQMMTTLACSQYLHGLLLESVNRPAFYADEFARFLHFWRKNTFHKNCSSIAPDIVDVAISNISRKLNTLFTNVTATKVPLSRLLVQSQAVLNPHELIVKALRDVEQKPSMRFEAQALRRSVERFFTQMQIFIDECIRKFRSLNPNPSCTWTVETGPLFGVKVLSEPKMTGKLVRTLQTGDGFEVASVTDDWFRLKSLSGDEYVPRSVGVLRHTALEATLHADDVVDVAAYLSSMVPAHEVIADTALREMLPQKSLVWAFVEMNCAWAHRDSACSQSDVSAENIAIKPAQCRQRREPNVVTYVDTMRPLFRLMASAVTSTKAIKTCTETNTRDLQFLLECWNDLIGLHDLPRTLDLFVDLRSALGEQESRDSTTMVAADIVREAHVDVSSLVVATRLCADLHSDAQSFVERFVATCCNALDATLSLSDTVALPKTVVGGLLHIFEFLQVVCKTHPKALLSTLSRSNSVVDLTFALIERLLAEEQRIRTAEKPPQVYTTQVADITSEITFLSNDFDVDAFADDTKAAWLTSTALDSAEIHLQVPNSVCVTDVCMYVHAQATDVSVALLHCNTVFGNNFTTTISTRTVTKGSCSWISLPVHNTAPRSGSTRELVIDIQGLGRIRPLRVLGEIRARSQAMKSEANTNLARLVLNFLLRATIQGSREQKELWAIRHMDLVRKFILPVYSEESGWFPSLLGTWTMPDETQIVVGGTGIARSPTSTLHINSTAPLSFVTTDGMRYCLKHSERSTVRWEPVDAVPKSTMIVWRRDPGVAENTSSACVQFPSCPQGHRVKYFLAPSEHFTCDKCGKRIGLKSELYGCRKCDFDFCTLCFASNHYVSAAVQALSPFGDISQWTSTSRLPTLAKYFSFLLETVLAVPDSGLGPGRFVGLKRVISSTSPSQMDQLLLHMPSLFFAQQWLFNFGSVQQSSLRQALFDAFAKVNVGEELHALIQTETDLEVAVRRLDGAALRSYFAVQRHGITSVEVKSNLTTEPQLSRRQQFLAFLLLCLGSRHDVAANFNRLGTPLSLLHAEMPRQLLCNFEVHNFVDLVRTVIHQFSHGEVRALLQCVFASLPAAFIAVAENARLGAGVIIPGICTMAIAVIHCMSSKESKFPIEQYLEGSGNQTFCANHGDGTTLAEWCCEDCPEGDRFMCSRCDKAMHVGPKRGTHFRRMVTVASSAECTRVPKAGEVECEEICISWRCGSLTVRPHAPSAHFSFSSVIRRSAGGQVPLSTNAASGSKQ